MTVKAEHKAGFAARSQRSVKQRIIDTVSEDKVLAAGYDAAATDRLRNTVDSFRQFIEENKDEITALQILYNQPYSTQELSLKELKELAEALQRPPHLWTEEALWNAYAQLERDRVRGVGARRTLTDLVSLVRHAVQLEDELIPYPDLVHHRYREWLAAQESEGRAFTEEQRWWLDRVAETIGVNLSVTSDDFQVGALFERGGWIAARRLFGTELPVLLEELNEALVV